MRTGISFAVSPTDRAHLTALIKDRNSPQKHVWRAEIVLLSAGGAGTAEIMRRTGKSKTCVWRWQERFAEEGFARAFARQNASLAYSPLGPEVAERVVALTLADPPVETTHWNADMMAKAAGISASAVRRIWKAHGLQRTAGGSLSSPTIRSSSTSCATSSASMSPRRPMLSCCRSTTVGKIDHVILDNYAAHKHLKVRQWLDRHERFTFHFTPTSCSWLNAVEGFFAKLAKRRLRRGVFHSVIDLQAAINRFLAEHNEHPKPFTWTADPDKIIAAVKRGHQALDSIH